MLGFPIGNIQIFLANLHIQFRLFLDPSNITDDRGKRCPKIVRHTGNQIIFCVLRHPFPLHQLFDIFLHLVHTGSNLSKFIFGKHRNLCIQISTGNILHRIRDHPHIFHISADQIIKGKNKHQDPNYHQNSSSKIRIQSVRSQHGASIPHIAQLSRYGTNKKCPYHFRPSCNNGADKYVKCHPFFKAFNELSFQFYILPPRLW